MNRHSLYDPRRRVRVPLSSKRERAIARVREAEAGLQAALCRLRPMPVDSRIVPLDSLIPPSRRKARVSSSPASSVIPDEQRDTAGRYVINPDSNVLIGPRRPFARSTVRPRDAYLTPATFATFQGIALARRRLRVAKYLERRARRR